MITTDVKLYALNFSAFFATLTTLTDILKIILLVASIAYTAHKMWINIMKNRDKWDCLKTF